MSNLNIDDLRNDSQKVQRFNPSENGFESATDKFVPDGPTGLDLLDQDLEKAIAEKRAEINEFNELIDMSEGNLTEDDIRETNSSVLTAKVTGDEQIDVPDDISNGTKKVEYKINTPDMSFYSDKIDTVDTVEKSPADVAQDIPSHSEMNFIDDEDDDLDYDEDEEETTLEVDDQTEKLKAAIRGKIKPVANVLDLKSFEISSSPVAFSATLNNVKRSTVRTADWALTASGKPITMKSFTGTEIANLSDTSGKTRYNAVRDQYNLIFSHIMNEDKPGTVEQWAKTISFLDIENIWFSVYRACFEGTNYLPYNCPDRKECKEVFLSDNTPIMDMVKFKDDAAKERFNKIMNMETDPNSGLITTELVQISDDYAFTFREPTIYNMIFESALLDQEFTTKYAELIALIVYIDQIFYINRDTHQLQPITCKVWNNNMAKTTKARIIQFSKVIQTLTSDQYSSIMAYIQNINAKGEDISYVIPEATCPKCQSVIPEQTYRASDLVFTRHQLATLAAL